MNKEFIPYEQALELKELGFDEPCLSSRDMNNDEGLIQIPLYQQAFRWFREKYGLNYSIVYFKNTMVYGWSVHYEGVFEFINTYEEAELECLKKLIEIVKTKT